MLENFWREFWEILKKWDIFRKYKLNFNDYLYWHPIYWVKSAPQILGALMFTGSNATKECSKVYIGETGRSFKLRVGEHKKQLQALQNSKISNSRSHCYSETRNRIYSENNSAKRKIAEPYVPWGPLLVGQGGHCPPKLKT